MSQSKKKTLGLGLVILALLGVLSGVPTGADDSAKVRVGLAFMGNPSHAAYPILRSRRMELGPPMVRTDQRPIGRANHGTMTYGREADEEGGQRRFRGEGPVARVRWCHDVCLSPI